MTGTGTEDGADGTWTDLGEFARRRRLYAVTRLGILDRIGDPVLASMVRLAQSVTGASSAAIHIFDDRYQRRIAAVNAPLTNHPEEDAMCRLVVESGEAIITPDASHEQRFAYSSFIQGDLPVRFYASLPLQISGHTTFGTLCAFDTVSHQLTPEQVQNLEDIAELVRAHLELMQVAQELARQATEDGLTGASSRAAFDSLLAKALKEFEVGGAGVVVALIDIDDFKVINDSRGHGRGDAALRWIAARLTDLLGTEAVVGRIGGDEFAVILRGTREAVAGVLAAMPSAPFGFDPPFSLSVGAAEAEHGDDVRTLMRRADAEMYAAKARRSSPSSAAG